MPTVSITRLRSRTVGALLGRGRARRGQVAAVPGIHQRAQLVRHAGQVLVGHRPPDGVRAREEPHLIEVDRQLRRRVRVVGHV